MEPESKNFGKGPRELTGAVDLISYYKLLPHYEFFCKKSLPLSISDTHYLHHAIGDTDIRKGEGMQLNQLIHNALLSRDTTNTRIHPFDMNTLTDAFQLRETAPVDLPSSKKGMPTIPGKSRSESKYKEKKHKKHKEKDKKHKHRPKDPSKDKDKEKKKDKSIHHDKKRKHDGNEDVSENHKQKKSKHKSSKIDEICAMKMTVGS